MPRACRYCTHLVGWDDPETERYALCRRSGTLMVRAQPELGCAFWEREPGSDDDLPVGADQGNEELPLVRR